MTRATAILAGTTPSDLSGVVGEFIEGQGWTPHRIPVRASPAARWGWCATNVRNHMKQHGGDMVLGWTIWAGPLLVEGEAHAVWRSPAGEMVDITPKPDGEREIVFCPEPAPDGWDGTGDAPPNRVRRLASLWDVLRDAPHLQSFSPNAGGTTRANSKKLAKAKRKARRKRRAG